MTSAVLGHRTHWLVWLTVFAACCLGLAGTYFLFVEAPPPRHVVMATGSKEGAYYKFAERYAELLKEEGINLELVPTRGSVENLELLMDDSSSVSVAFVQTGIVDPENSSSLRALCSLYREPLWIFYRGHQAVDRLTQLQGKRIAVGAEGSGTRGITLQLLQANGVDENNAEFHDISGNAAAEALLQDQIDTAFFVAGIGADYVQKLLTTPGIRLVELNQVEAYERQFRFLSTVKIHSGLIDIQHNIPSKTTVMIAPAATLVAHSSLHPALVSLLLKVATKVHRSGDLLASAGEFPSPSFTDLPIAEEAERYFRVGPPVLQRIMPFWLASMVDRLKVMVIPLFMLLMPLVRIAPPLVRWQTRRRIYLWYDQLRTIDRRAIHGMLPDEAKEARTDLRVLEKQIARVGVPLSYMEEYYNLRMHLNLVYNQVNVIIVQAEAPEETPTSTLNKFLQIPPSRLQNRAS